MAKLELEQGTDVLSSEAKTVSFEVTPSVAKAYQVSVDGLAGSFIAR